MRGGVTDSTIVAVLRASARGPSARAAADGPLECGLAHRPPLDRPLHRPEHAFEEVPMIIAWIFAALVSAIVVPAPASAGERFLANPKLATDCESALVKDSISFALAKLKQLDKCAITTLKCIQTVKPNDNADVDPVDACLEKALTRCDKANAVIADEDQKLTDAITAACSALDPSEVLRADGVGFEAITSDCLDQGVTLSDLASVVECVVTEHDCAVERMYMMAHPRAGELFDLVGTDIGNCLDDLGGPGEGVNDEDLKLGHQLVQCQQGVTKLSANYVASKLKNTGQCLEDLFDCVQLKPGDQSCLDQAQQGCDKLFANVVKTGTKLVPSVDKTCDPISFPALYDPTGVDYFDVVDNELCIPYGVSDIGTVNHYANCMYRSNECDGEELLKFSVPRGAELLGLVNRTLPGMFFCVPPEDF
jgi:hypothetical protein